MVRVRLESWLWMFIVEALPEETACMVHLTTSDGTSTTSWHNPPAIPARMELTGAAISPGCRLGSKNRVAELSPVKIKLLIRPS